MSLVHKPGSVTPVFGATMGTPEEAGDEMLRAAVRTGLGQETKIHCVGDGATWIADQVNLKFGVQANFLVDFYHVCDYLSAAGETIAGEDKRDWMQTQKNRLKQNGVQDVVEQLRPFLEHDSVSDSAAPVRAAHRYITNRPGQFNYQSALVAGLPIGSGEVESAHRYVIQARLKLAGAWWKTKNASRVLALRVARSNGDWEKYWSSRHQQAA